MSDNAGCLGALAVIVFGFVALMWISTAASDAARRSEDERYRVCVESGGVWDGFWKSCTKASP